MENNIFEHQFGDGAEDMKLKSFVADAVPAEADMSSIKKKTYAKIRQDNERRRTRRMITLGLALAASIALLVVVTVVPRGALSGMTDGVAALAEPKTVTLAVPLGQTRAVTLPDGTKLVANSRSTVSYPERFDGDTRDIHVKGEVYLDVAHDKEHPFIVHTGGFSLKVLGTKFNLCSYDARRASVVLVEGSVEVTTKSNDKVKMRPSQLLNVSDGQLDGLRTVDTSQYTSWMKGIMDLHGDDIHQVVGRINDYYGTDIGVHGKMAVTPLYGKLVFQKDVDDVLKAINTITGTRVEVINGKACITKRTDK